MKARKKEATNPAVKSTMLTLRVTPDVLEMIEMAMAIMNGERSFGSKAPTRSEAVELLIRWGWKAYESQNQTAADGLKKVRKKSA